MAFIAAKHLSIVAALSAIASAFSFAFMQNERIIKKIYEFALSVELAPCKLTNAPIIKGKNIEYLALFEKGASPVSLEQLLKSVVL